MSYVNDKYNKKVNKYTFECDNPVYTKLSDLYTKNKKTHVYTLRALYLAEKGEFPHPVAVVDVNTYVDLPPHMLDTVKEMRADSVLTDLINAGKVGFTIYTYDSPKRKGPCYAVDFCDIEPETPTTDPETPTTDPETPTTDDDLPFQVD